MFQIKPSEVSGCGRGPYRQGNTVMDLEYSLLIINNKQFIIYIYIVKKLIKGRYSLLFGTTVGEIYTLAHDPGSGLSEVLPFYINNIDFSSVLSSL